LKKQLAIFGAGGLGREVLSLLKALPQWEVTGFYDDGIASGTVIRDDLKVIGGLEALRSITEKTNIVLAIGSPDLKQRIAAALAGIAQLQFATLIHPSAILQEPNAIAFGPGCVIGAGCILTTEIEVGAHVLININCTVGHNVKIGKFASIMPGVWPLEPEANLLIAATLVSVGLGSLVSGIGPQPFFYERVNHGLLAGLGSFFVFVVERALGPALVEVIDGSAVGRLRGGGETLFDGMELFEPGLHVGIQKLIGVFVFALLQQMLAEDAGAFGRPEFLPVRLQQLQALFQLLLVFVDEGQFDYAIRVVWVRGNGGFEQIDFERLEGRVGRSRQRAQLMQDVQCTIGIPGPEFVDQRQPALVSVREDGSRRIDARG